MDADTDTAIPVLTSVGIDIAKDVFHIVCSGPDSKIAFRRKIKRLALAETFRKLPPCIVGMEACLSAHFVSLTPKGAGTRATDHDGYPREALHKKGQKNDYNDTEAIAEAALRPNLHLVRENNPRSGQSPGLAPRPWLSLNHLAPFGKSLHSDGRMDTWRPWMH